MTYTGAGPRARAQPLGIGDGAWTDPSTYVVPVLNHEAVVGGLSRVYDVHGIDLRDRQVIMTGGSCKETS